MVGPSFSELKEGGINAVSNLPTQKEDPNSKKQKKGKRECPSLHG